MQLHPLPLTQALMAEDRGYFAYREHFIKASHPKMPYLGVYLTDLTMLYEAKRNNDRERQAVMGKVVREFCETVAESHYKLDAKVSCAHLYENACVFLKRTLSLSPVSWADLYYITPYDC